MAKFYFKYSPMEAGKSAMLLIEAYNFEKRKVGHLCMKPSIDNRENNDKIRSRIGIEQECFLLHPNYDIFHIIKQISIVNGENGMPLQWILIDESQFLSTEQVEQLRAIVDDLNINVLCYGLRTDFQTHLFEGSKRLLELADDISELKISCKCGRKAIFNARFNENNELIQSGEQILIGGEEIYRPMCSKCYREEIAKQNEK